MSTNGLLVIPSASAGWLAAAVAVPLCLLLLCAWSRLRRPMAALFVMAPLPALMAALLADDGSAVKVGNADYTLTLSLDAPGAMLLLAAALLWSLAGLSASRYVRERSAADGFIVCWLMTMVGSIGVFLAADLIAFYVLLAVLSVGASGLVLQGEGPGARRAGALYLGVALLAEAFLLAGLVLLAQASPGGSLLIRDAVAALPGAATRNTTLALLLLGLGMKAGVVPLHVWMPIAYAAAPTAAAAVMSGAVVKASLIALIRFLPSGVPLPEFGQPLAALGLLGAFYGVALGITQSRPQVVLAYSSVSQMGFMVAMVGMGLAAGERMGAMALAFYATHHLLVKGALFLAVGVIVFTGRRRRWLLLLPAVFIGLGLAGLPLTSGALAKDEAKAFLGDGLAGTLAGLTSVASALLMTHFLRCLTVVGASGPDARAPWALVVSWISAAVASQAVPWTYFLAIQADSPAIALTLAGFWSGLWPVLAGAVLALWLNRVARTLPRIPVGALTTTAWDGVRRACEAAGLALERADTGLRHWSVASIALVLVVVLLGWTLRV